MPASIWLLLQYAVSDVVNHWSTFRIGRMTKPHELLNAVSDVTWCMHIVWLEAKLIRNHQLQANAVLQTETWQTTPSDVIYPSLADIAVYSDSLGLYVTSPFSQDSVTQQRQRPLLAKQLTVYQPNSADGVCLQSRSVIVVGDNSPASLLPQLMQSAIVDGAAKNGCHREAW